MNKDWLTAQITVEEAEAKHMKTIGRIPRTVPFGFLNDSWKNRILGQMIQGDELWEFSNSSNHWENLAGRRGIALVRDGEIIASITTLMN